MEALVYFVLPVILLILGLPVFVVLLLTGMVGIGTSENLPLQSLHTVVFGALDNFPLLAVPLFILAE